MPRFFCNKNNTYGQQNQEKQTFCCFKTMKVDPCGMGVSDGNGWLRSFADAQAASPITWQTCFGKRANAALKLQNIGKKWNPISASGVSGLVFNKKENDIHVYTFTISAPWNIQGVKACWCLFCVKKSGFLWFFPFGIKKNEDFLILVGVSWHIV